MLKTLLAVGVLALAAVTLFACRSSAADLPPTGKSSPLDFTLKANDGSDYPLAQHRGKVVLLVNTASKCGYTKQYAGLQTLWTTYRSKGLVVIGIPSDNFMGQEFGTDAEVAAFCTKNFGVTFPLMAKVDVKGDTQAPLYTFLTKESSKPGKISWNFNKFLVGRDGQLIERYGSGTAPDDQVFISQVEAALAVTVPKTLADTQGEKTK
jgi:glutathione peroxidase